MGGNENPENKNGRFLKFHREDCLYYLQLQERNLLDQLKQLERIENKLLELKKD